MGASRLRILLRVVSSVAILAMPLSATAANYPLELTNIRPAGSAGWDNTGRIYRAYPGLEYNIRAAVIGGAYPYTFALLNAPSGMSIDSRGVISWPNPQSDATPTITVRDAEGSQVSTSWTIRVSTAGFRFVDAVSGMSTGDGSPASPWRTMSDVYYGAGATDIIYFRAGTYNQLTLPRSGVGSTWERVEWDTSRGRPVIWLAHPGETPVIDFGYSPGVEAGPMIRLAGNAARPSYVDGFETTNTGVIGFQVPNTTGTFRRMRMRRLLLGGAGTNAAFIMTTGGAPASGLVIQDSEFSEIAGSISSVTIKIYSQHKLLIEDTVHHDVPVGIELKNSASQYTVRGNRFYSISTQSLGGNMQATDAVTYGEICFNDIQGSSIALQLNQNSEAGLTHVYRNTIRGRLNMLNVAAGDGPFLVSHNVIVNNDSGTPAGSHVYHSSVSDTSRITLTNNLSGYPSAGILDAAGRLTSSYSSYRGTHGFELASGSVQVPSAPSNVRVLQ